MKQKIILLSFFVYAANVFGQEPKKDESNVKPETYKMAIGGKFYPTGVTFKYFMNKGNAIEAVGYFYGLGMRITGLYEIHKPLKGIPGVRWYFGGGAHASLFSARWAAMYNANAGFGIGIDGVIGVDYKFKDYPINISLDWQPSLNVVPIFYGDAGFGGLGIRYVLK